MKSRSIHLLACCLMATSIACASEETDTSSNGLTVKITRSIETVEINHNNKPLTIMRNQDTQNLINPGFAKTSRKCPPFCIQPMTPAPGVETIDELQMLDYLKRKSNGDDSILVIDSRSADWVKRGTIPGAINIHFQKLSNNSEENVAEILEDDFGVTIGDALLDFTYAKTLVFFCNGIWCGQSPTNIKSLARLGYPPHKLKYYRGGMQAWESLGLTTVKPE